MKKVLLFTILLLLFPMVASAKTLNITALVDSNIKENVTELLVTFDSSIGEDGVVDYSLNKSKNFKRTIKDFPDSDEVLFLYGTVVVDGVIDSLGKYSVECLSTQESNGTYNILLKVTDPTAVTTTKVQDTQKADTSKYKRFIAYSILGFVGIIILIFVLLILIKVLRTSRMY